MNMENPFGESLQNPLEKYGRDITKAVKDGKVDPVIGRDEEVRSITRILLESQVLVKLLLLKDLLKEL